MSDPAGIPLTKKARRRPSPGLLRRAQAAHYCAVGVSTWDRWAAAGQVPAAVKIGGAVCWSRHELAEWCRHGCPPQAEWGSIWRAMLVARRTPKRY